MIFIFLINGSKADIFVNCLDNGRITVVEIPKTESKVIAREKGGKWFNVPGDWKFSDVGTFNSDDGIFVKKGLYEVRVVSAGGGYFHKEIICPGFRFSCNFLKLDPNECYSLNEYWFVKFHAYNIVSPYDLEFVITDSDDEEYGYSSYLKNSKIRNLSISSAGLTKYVMAFKIDKNVTSVSITHEYCDKKSEKYYTYETLSCNKACSNDRVCDENEYCNLSTNLCARLSCESCQIINDHQCRPKCVDPSPCSKAMCDNVSEECYYSVSPGCIYNDTCVKVGTILDHNISKKYCSRANVFLEQKKDNESCSEYYECLNLCVNSTCVLRIDYGYNITIAPFKNDSKLLNRTNQMIIVEQEYEKTAKNIYQKALPYLLSIILSFIFVLTAIFISKTKKRKAGFQKRKVIGISKFLDEKIINHKIQKEMKLIEIALQKEKIFSARAHYQNINEMYKKLSNESKAKIAEQLLKLHEQIEKQW